MNSHKNDKMNKGMEILQNLWRCLKSDPNTLSDEDYFTYYAPVACLGMIGFILFTIILLMF